MSVVPAHPTQRRLSDIAAFLGIDPSSIGGVDRAVRGIAQHSHDVRPGVLYVARPGVHAHGAGYAGAAASAGAVAAVTDPAGRAPCEQAGLPTLVVPDPAAILGPLSGWIHGNPTHALTLLGVTGTNGKTTTTYLLDAALRAAGHRTGLIGTVETRIGDEAVPSMRTTPEAPDLQGLFAVMREQGVAAASMEVSSHALELGRVTGSSFDVAGFTNLSQDHLEQHGDLEAYFTAKASLFTPELTRVGVVNVDDDFGVRLATEAAGRGLEIVTISPSGTRPAAWRAGPVEYAPDGALRFGISGPGGTHTVTLGLPGDFNVANALLAVAMLHVVGVDPEVAVGGLTRVAMPGRMERVRADDNGVLAIVDYAHTPAAIAAVLASMRRGTAGRLFAVFGCGGDRDKGKRAAMGAEAARAADVVVITDDNPRTEDPAAIRAVARAGAESLPATERAEVVEIGDRRGAIGWAIGNAVPGDTVLVLGKGHEKGQEISGVVHPFDDREAVAAALGLAPERI